MFICDSRDICACCRCGFTRLHFFFRLQSLADGIDRARLIVGLESESSRDVAESLVESLHETKSLCAKIDRVAAVMQLEDDAAESREEVRYSFVISLL